LGVFGGGAMFQERIARTRTMLLLKQNFRCGLTTLTTDAVALARRALINSLIKRISSFTCAGRELR
jgi:hypothetical protein